MRPDVALSIFAAVLVALSCFLAARGIDAALGAERRQARARLDALSADADTPSSTSGQRRAAPRFRRNGRLAARLRADLRRAGLAWTVLDYVAIAALAGAGCGLATSIATGSLPLATLAGLVAAGVPPYLVQRRVATRAAQLNGQVVQTIELIASSLRSGFGFMQSIEFAAREQSEPIAGELRAMIRETELGVSVDEALERLLARTRDADLELVVSAVLVQRRVGGDLLCFFAWNIVGMIRTPPFLCIDCIHAFDKKKRNLSMMIMMMVCSVE